MAYNHLVAHRSESSGPVLIDQLPREPDAAHATRLTLHLSQACPVRVEADSFFLTDVEKSALASCSTFGTLLDDEGEPSAGRFCGFISIALELGLKVAILVAPRRLLL